MTITPFDNGQLEVRSNNLVLVQTIINGERFNDCAIHGKNGVELVSSSDERFKEHFTALYNFKQSNHA